MKINRTTLNNGLRLVHHEDRNTQMVAVNTLYRVGSRNESPEHTGFAHLFEHLMFGGSIHVADYDKELQSACGENNAYTDADFTNYYVTVPAQNIETAFWLESDRMLSLAFTPDSLEVQRKVVMEEFKQNYLNQPYGDLGHILFDAVYKVHPYRWPTIGLELSHIADATMDQVKSFFHRFYRPDNAIIAVDGNISWERTQELVRKWYGGIDVDERLPLLGLTDAGAYPSPTEIAQEPRQERQRRRTVRRTVSNSVIVIAFNIPSASAPEFRVCDMLSDVMANGKSSRFYRHLVEDRQLFLSIDASVMGRVDGGLLLIEGVLPEGADVDACEQAIWDEIRPMLSDLSDDRELEKLKNKFESNHELQCINYLQRAQNLAHYEAYGNAEWINNEVARYQAITPEDLRKAARKYLTKRNSTVVRYLNGN